MNKEQNKNFFDEVNVEEGVVKSTNRKSSRGRSLSKFLFSSVLAFICAISFSFALVGCTKENEYTISFQTNGGATISDVTLVEGTTYTLPTPEAREGYNFLGWYATEDFSGEAVTEITSSQNASYYAKWEQLALITLDVNGGKLDSETKLYVAEGTNVYNLVKDLVPTMAKEGYQFGAWFNGDKELHKNTSASLEGITLTAQYKVQYTVEVYVQSLTQDGYEKSETKIVGYEYAGKNFTSQQTVEGCKEIAHENSVTSGVISETASENVFKHYFNRNSYKVTFNSNYPDDTEDTKTTQEVLFGEMIDIPSNYQYNGYCLIGWATSADGEVVYAVDAISGALYNKPEDFEETPAQQFTPVRNTNFYAVWKQGYKDMFGGDDYIFLFGDKVYLLRENVFFQGEYYEEENIFEFLNSKDELLVEGKFLDENTFAYHNGDRDDYVASLYDFSARQLSDDIKIFFDAYNGITYAEGLLKGDAKESVGTYTIDEYGYYTATFTSGPKKGTEMYFLVGTVKVGDTDMNAFQVRNEEDIALGSLTRFGVYEGQLVTYRVELSLNGFGVATLTTTPAEGEPTAASYYYTRTDDSITLLNAYGQAQGVFRIVEQNGKKGFALYDQTFANEYTSENGNKLTLDGMYTVTYTVGEKTITGYYTLGAQSVMGGQLVNVTDATNAAQKYTFLLRTETSEVTTEKENENGEMEEVTETVTKYVFEQRNNGYAEYYYKDAKGYYYGPLFVISDAANNKAEIYAYSKTKQYALAATGTYTYDEATKLYTFVKEKDEEIAPELEIFTEPVDIATIKSFVFALDSTSTQYSINYWYSSTTEEDVTTDYQVEYTGSKGEKLTLVAGLAVYTAENDKGTVTGLYEIEDGTMAIQVGNSVIYLQMNEEEKTFVTYEHTPYMARIAKPNGSVEENAAVYFDGLGGVKYLVVTQDEDGKNVQTEYAATFALTDKTTADGDDIYQLVCQDLEISYLCLRLYASQAVYLFPYNDTYNGEYTGDGILTLDGFGYRATYVDKDGANYTGMYFINAENEVSLLTDYGYRYFDLKEGKLFTARGTEYGTYIFMENQGMPGYYLEVNGYGEVTIFKMEKAEVEGEEAKRIDVATVPYTLVDGVCKIEFTDGDKKITWEGEFGSYVYGQYSYRVFIKYNEEVENVYVNGNDWAVLILDDLGNAIKYNTEGQKEEGMYLLITENLLYYVNNAGSDAHIYEYDPATGAAKEQKFNTRGYYTEDLKGLQFSEYGFVIMNGVERNYYNVVEGNVLIYKQDAENPAANQYGFVETNLGAWGDTLFYNEEIYYKHDGYALSFVRNEATKNSYPVLVNVNADGTENRHPLAEVVFTPAGSEEFTVLGEVTIDGKQYDAYVTRALNDEEVMETYITIANYRFDITLTYMVENGATICSYEVTGMRLIQNLNSYSYLSQLYVYKIYDMFLGTNMSASFKNEIGVISLVTEFDAEGKETISYANATFGTASGMVDMNGENLSFEKMPYEQQKNEEGKETGVYVITLTPADGQTYKFYFTLQAHSALQQYGYVNIALVRVQEMEKITEGYALTVERIIASDYASQGYSVGSVFSLNLTKGETELKADILMTYAGSLYYVVRDKNEEGVITKTEYYKIDLQDANSGEIEEEKTTVGLYESAEITLVEVETKYTEDGKSFVDVAEGLGITLVSLEGKLYVATEQTVEGKIYTITLNSGDKYTVQYEGTNVTLTKVVETENEEESEEA